MFTQLSNLAKGAIYYGMTLSMTLFYVLLLPPEKWLNFVMLLPTVGALLMLLVVTRDGYSRQGWADLGLHRLGRSAWGLALLAPLFIIVLSYGIAWGLDVVRLALPTERGSMSHLVLNTLIDSLFMLFLLGPGEEIGWRGYMLPRLLPFGATRAIVLTGFAHAVWHLPIILFTPYLGEDTNLFAILVFILLLTVGGIFYGYMRLKTNSIWPAILFHAAWNIVMTLLAAVSVGTTPLASTYLVGEGGILTLLISVAASAWILYLMKKRVQPVPVPA